MRKLKTLKANLHTRISGNSAIIYGSNNTTKSVCKRRDARVSNNHNTKV